MSPSSAPAESSLLLIVLAATMAVLSAHIALGWLHEAQRRSGWLGARGGALLVASAALGTGMCASSVLALAGEALAFPIGYRWAAAPLLWAGAVGGSVAVGLLLLAGTRWWNVVGAGLLVGALVLAVHTGWIEAAGFRPGVSWEPLFIGSAVALLAVGCCSALLLDWTDNGGRGTWRLGAGMLIGLSAVTGIEVLNSGLALPTQIGSVYARQLDGGMLSLVCGVVLPLVMAVLAVDLRLRRRQRRRSRRDVSPGGLADKPRKRRHRIPTL